jgi:hypothetical protein
LHRNTLCEKAVKRFLDGYNCAQSVLLTMFEFWNGENALIPKIATGFGGGIGRCGSVCGALTGGVMALGVKYGTNEPSSVFYEEKPWLRWHMVLKHNFEKPLASI